MPSNPCDRCIRTTSSSPAENERCPRCSSLNTKFCYFNNYSLAQPRHFCKSCRRYWTLGGTLRNVPVGGGSRKPSASSSSKRRRPSTTSSASPSSSSSSPSTAADPLVVTPISVAPSVDPTTDESTANSTDVDGSFASLLTEPLPTGFLELGDPFLQEQGGFGLGLELGLGSSYRIEEMGVGMGRTTWPFLGEEEVGGGVGVVGYFGDGGVGGGDGDTWHAAVGGGETAAGEGDFFGWPELAIPTPPGSKGLL